MPSVPLNQLDGRLRKNGGRDHAVVFRCPLCENGHSIAVSWEPPSKVQGGYIWTRISGTTIDDLTLAPSINCDVPWKDMRTGISYPSSCKFHGYIRSGKVEW